MLKSVFRFWPAVLVLVTVGFLGSCTWIIDIFRPDRDIQIHSVAIGGAPEDATFTPDPVSAFPLDFIEWRHPFAQTVVIELQGVPVTPRRLVLREGVSGRVMVWDTASAGRYKYVVKVVRVVGDTIVFDPYIDVEEKSGRGGGS